MSSTRFVKIISTFNKEEWISFRKYLLMQTTIESDNFRVFEYFQKRKDRLQTLPNTQEIRTQHFVKLKQKSFLNILSRLYLWVEEWLIYYTMLHDKRESNLQLVKLYNRRGLFDLADQKSNQLKRILTKDKSISIEKSRISQQLLYNQYYSDNPSKFKNNTLSLLAHRVLVSHHEQKLLVYNELLNMNSQTNIYNDIIDEYNLESKNSDASPEIEILNVLRNIITNHSVEDFYLLKSKLINKEVEANSDLEVILCNYLFNYSFILVTMNKLKERNSTLEIAHFGLQHNLFTAGRSLSSVRYINIVSTLSKINDYSSIMMFVNRWADAVATEDSNSLKIFSEALFHIVNQQYQKIPIQPILLHFNNIYLKLHSTSFYLISCYNHSEIDYVTLYSTIRTLKRTLFRYKKILNHNFYKSYFNYMKVMTLLIEKEKVDLEKFNPIMHKNWLLKNMNAKR